jgi:hypothetical protein
VGSAVGVGLLYPNTGDNSSPFLPGKPKIIPPEPASTPLPKRDRVSSQRTLSTFVRTAVLRKNLDRSYDLVDQQLKGGLSRAEWRTGDIPVIPFPAKDFAFAKSKLRYSHGNVARYDVAIFARPKGNTGSAVFLVEMHAQRLAGKRRWLVDYWEPESGGIFTSPSSGTSSAAGANTPAEAAKPLATSWVLVPLSILSLIVLVPAALAIRGWLRNRRADRDYARRLPPLPPT